MSFDEWLAFLRELSRLSGSLDFFDFDAPSLDGLLFNIDGYEASESRLPWMSWSDWGWRAVIASISDVLASGGRPVAVLYSVGGPSKDVVLEVVRGVSEACRWAGVRVLKADTNRSSHDTWIDVVVIGVTMRAISRAGGRPGDLLVQVGPIGYGLVAEMALRGVVRIDDYPRSLEFTRRPRVDLGIGLRLSECGVRAAIDNSDGWAVTLYQLSKASGVKLVVDKLLVVEEALRLLDKLGLGELELFRSWEDYNIAAVIPEDRVECLLSYCRSSNIQCDVVGRVEAGEGVYFKGKPVEPRGWTWF